MRKWYSSLVRAAVIAVVALQFGAALSADAQISIVKSDFEALYGTRQTISTYDATTTTGAAAIIAAGGANQTWDFTNMTWSLSGIGTVDYLTSWSSKPGADDPRFASATIATQAWDVENPTPSDTSAVIYQQATDSGIWILGIGTTGNVDDAPPTPDTVLIVNDPPSLDLWLPYTYGLGYTDSTDQTSEVNGTPFISVTLVTTVSVDGWGTLVLPSGSYAALRSYRIEKSRIFGFTSYHYYYEFLTKSHVSASIEVDEFGNPIAADYEVNETSLPVELTALNATVSGSTARLSWQTLSESGNAGFFVQHQAPGGAFVDAGFVSGGGTSDRRLSYSYDVAVGRPGVHRFRLRQVDVDGTFAYSAMTEVVVGASGGIGIEVYPNPFVDRAAVVVSSARAQDVSVDVFDVLGRRVQTLFRGTMESGQSRTLSLSADGLVPGVYFVRMNGDGTSVTHSVLLER